MRSTSYSSGPNAEEALIHKLEGGDKTTTATNVNEHDSIGRMAGAVRDKDGGGEIRRLAAKAKAKQRASLRRQEKDGNSGK